MRATRNYFYTTHHALTAECSLILSGFGFADTSSDSPLISRAAKEMIEKRFGRIWHPDGAKKMPTLCSARGALSRVSRVPGFRVEEDEEEQAAISDMSVDIDYLE